MNLNHSIKSSHAIFLEKYTKRFRLIVRNTSDRERSKRNNKCIPVGK